MTHTHVTFDTLSAHQLGHVTGGGLDSLFSGGLGSLLGGGVGTLLGGPVGTLLGSALGSNGNKWVSLVKDAIGLIGGGSSAGTGATSAG